MAALSMGAGYSDAVVKKQPPLFARPTRLKPLREARHRDLPRVLVLSDARNDAQLAGVLRRLPRGSALVFRHYHLDPAARRARFEALKRLARRFGHITILADDPATARAWRADGVYGAPSRLARARRGGLALYATAHSVRELGDAARIGADGVLLSPVFATRSHPGAPYLGVCRFALMARLSKIPVIALGGMNAKRARSIGYRAWAAIDGLGGSGTPRKSCGS